MADPRLEHLFRSLDATFSAVIAAEEKQAADDLALSFRQGLTLVDLLARHPSSICVGDRAFGPASAVGEGYVECGSSRSLVPLTRALIKIKEEGDPATPSEVDLLQRLRRATRSSEGAQISVGAWNSTLEGRLSAAAADHLEIQRAGARLLVPMAQVEWIRFGRGG